MSYLYTGFLSTTPHYFRVSDRVSPSIRNHSSLLCSLSSTRRSFVTTLPSVLQMANRSYPPYSPTPTSVNQAVQLLDSVYGPVTSNDFPLPMRPNEAGPCNDEEQRRYLWTDAFAVMAYQSLAEYHHAQSSIEKSKIYQNAVDKLISVVHDCLGKPRSVKEEDGMTPCEISPTGYVGLRIGKVRYWFVLDISKSIYTLNTLIHVQYDLLFSKQVESRKVTDYGMMYDGMYGIMLISGYFHWHGQVM